MLFRSRACDAAFKTWQIGWKEEVEDPLVLLPGAEAVRSSRHRREAVDRLPQEAEAVVLRHLQEAVVHHPQEAEAALPVHRLQEPEVEAVVWL